jgi:hypothetical protein
VFLVQPVFPKIFAPEVIEGIIKWDEQERGKLPKIVTAHKTYTWRELGAEIMIHEGFRISIKLS